MKRIFILIISMLILIGCGKAQEIELVEEVVVPMTQLVPATPITFYRSINSDVYHIDGCMYLDKILDENLTEFTEITDDLRRCNICRFLV